MTAQKDFSPSVLTLGQGPRRVLALHCTMAYGGAWSGFAKQLGDGFTLIAPDMPSHGTSVDWDETSDLSDTVCAASLEEMDEAPMDIIGHSFGAVIALRLAVQHPEKVRSLTVIEPVFFAAALAFDPQATRDHGAQAGPYLEALRAGEYELAARLFNRMWSAGGPKWDNLSERTRAAMARAIHVVPGQHSFLFDDTSGLLAKGGLDAVKAPTLIIRGSLANPAIVAVNNALAQIMPNATQSVIEGAGHMAPISHPNEVAAVWSRFAKTAQGQGA